MDGERAAGPEDGATILAFHGLAHGRLRGSMLPGKEVEDLAISLRGPADALDVFNSYARRGVLRTATRCPAWLRAVRRTTAPKP